MLHIDWTSTAHEKTFIWQTAMCKCFCSKLWSARNFWTYRHRWNRRSHCNYSNLYANQSIGNKEFKKTSRLCKWEVITAPAIRLYLAALIYLGILYKPKKHFYYTKKNLFETPEFRSQNKMVLLEKFLHFVNNEEPGDSYNKAAKIQPILEKLVERFKLLCQLERDISIDKSLLLRKGCLNWKQYIPK